MTTPLPWVGAIRTQEEIDREMPWLEKWYQDRVRESRNRVMSRRPVDCELYPGSARGHVRKASRQTLSNILNGTYHQQIATDHGEKENAKRFIRNNDGFRFVVVG